MRQKSFRAIILVLLFLAVNSFFMQVKAITWSVKVNQLTTYEYYDGFPAFAQTKDGRVWFVWSRELAGNLSLYYKISSDQGRTWSEKKNMTKIPASGDDQNPSIIQAKNQTIWVVWTSDRPPILPEPPPDSDFYMNATPPSLTIPQGGSDTSTINVTSMNNFNDTINFYTSSIPNVTSVLDPSQVYIEQNETATSLLTVTVDAAATPGNYTLRVVGEPLHHRFLRHLDIPLEITSSTASSSNTAKTTPASSSPSSSSASEVSIRDFEIYYKTSHDNGETWSQAFQLTTNVVDDLRPSIIQLTNGTIMIFWQTYVLDSFNIVYTTTTDGTTWSDMKQLTIDPANDKTPAATQAKDGKIWVVWASTRDGDYEIYYKTYDGIAWTGAQRLTYNTNSDVQPVVVQAIDGNIMIFWASGSPTSTFDIYYKISSNNGAPWSDRIEYVGTGYEDMWPAVMRARDTRIWVAWYNNEADQPNGNWDIYFRTSLAGDVNEDNQINVVDLTIVSLAYGTMEGEPGYNPVADINKDGFVEMRDLVIVAYYLGET